MNPFEPFMQHYKKQFITFLQIEKNASPLTIQSYQRDIDVFYRFVRREAVERFDDIDHHTVRLFLTMLHEEQLSRRTVSRMISSLRTFFNFLKREEVHTGNPFLQISLPKSDNPIPSFLYEEELEELFKIHDLEDPLGQRNLVILEILYATGIRVSELVQIETNDIDFTIGSIFIKGKGNKERYVMFGQYAKDALHLYLTEGREKLLQRTQSITTKVFLNHQGQPLTTRGVRHILKQIVKKASLTIHVTPHKLRHTFATHMLNNGADLRTVQELLGHENLSSTQIYTHVTKDYLQNIYMNSHPRATDG